MGRGGLKSKTMATDKKEQEVAEYAVELYFQIRLNRISPALKETVLTAIPNLVEHFDKELSFKDSVDAERAFRFFNYCWKKNKTELNRSLKKDNVAHRAILMNVLKQPELASLQIGRAHV